MSEYEYRPVYRVSGEEWRTIHTNRAAGRAYLTAAGARAVITRERKDVRNRAEWDRRRAERRGIAYVEPAYEYAVQRRAVGDWEDLPADGREA